ncbi:MAG: GNAT family N-acetyltransferase [Saprospiraceae bacterium]
MKIELETPRLYLRELVESDAEDMFEMDGDPEVHRYLGNNPQTQLEQALETIRYVQDQYERNGIGRWAVIEKSSGNFLGWSGLKYVDDMEINGMKNFYDLGYRYKKNYWGKGFGFEAAEACKEYAFRQMGILNLHGFADLGNIGSRRILQKVGLEEKGEFEFEGSRCVWMHGRNPYV